MEIKRQIWLIDEGLFRDKVFPLLNQHISDIPELTPENPLPPARRREADAVLQELAHLVGKSIALYNMLLHFFRTLFVSTKNAGFCALRADLLMALHDAGVAEIYHLDPCHKFAWCLDACVRDNAIEVRRINEMQTYFNAVPTNDPILGDLAMIVASPHSTNMLVRNIFITLVDVVNRESIPKEDKTLVYMTWLLSMGLRAEQMISEQSFYIATSPDKEILQTFYPLLAFRILDDAMRTPEGAAPQAPQGPGQQPPPARALPPAEPLEDGLLSLMYRSPLVQKVMLYYVLTRVSARDAPSVEMLLSTFTQPYVVEEDADVDMEDGEEKKEEKEKPPASPLLVITEDPAFVTSLVTNVLAARDPRTTHVVIDTFLFAHRAESAHIHKQLVRFLIESQSKLNPRDVVTPLPSYAQINANLTNFSIDVVYYQNIRQQYLNQYPSWPGIPCTISSSFVSHSH